MAKTFGQRPSDLIGLGGPIALRYDFDQAVHWWGNYVESECRKAKDPADRLADLMKDPASLVPEKMTPIPPEVFKLAFVVR